MNNYGPDIFRTNADTRFNSFTGPSAMSYSQANSGSWGVNPNLLTPSYTAAYRPTYNGNQGDPNSPRPNFGQSLNQVINPFAGGGDNYGGNVYQQQSPFFDTLGYNPLDRGTSITQKWVVPGFASWISYRFLAKPLGDMGERLAGGMVTGMAGKTFSAGTTATMGAVAGNLGRIGGAMFGPMVAAQTISWIADKAVFDPYIAQRQMTNDLRRDFAGVTFGDGSGNSITGKGYSRYAAARQARQISMMGAEDMTFNQSEVSNLTDLSARSGLLDTVQGGQVADRMKMITKQVKLVMQVANTSDFKEAIEILSKLQTSGVGIKDVTSVLTRLGDASSIAGVSFQKMMGTVGAQGGYTFGSNGMTPYVGQLTAANAYAGFSAAYRSGLISPDLMARMGGVEGATQSATTGLLNMAQSPFAKMTAYNKYMLGGDAGSVTSNVSKFSGAMNKNPLLNYGAALYYEKELASKSLEQDGLQGKIDLTRQIAGNIRGALDKNGDIDARALMPLLMQTQGLTEPEARALIEAQRAAQDPEQQKQARAGITSQAKEAWLRSRINEKYIFGPLNFALRPAYILGNEAVSHTAGNIGTGLAFGGALVDKVEETWFGRYGDIKNQVSSGDNLEHVDADFGGGSLFQNPWEKSNLKGDYSISTGSRTLFGVISEKTGIGSKAYIQAAITTISTQKDPAIVDAIKNKDSSKLKLYIASLASSGKIDPVFKDPKNQDELVRALLTRGTITDAFKNLTNQRVTGISDKEKASNLLKLVEKVHGQGGVFKEEDFTTYKNDTGDDTTNPDIILGKLAIIEGRQLGKTDEEMSGNMFGIGKVTSKDFIGLGNDVSAKNAQSDEEKRIKNAGGVNFANLPKLEIGNVNSMNVSTQHVTLNVGGIGLTDLLPWGKKTPPNTDENIKSNHDAGQ